MSINSIFSIFLPKEDKFFPRFQQVSKNIVEGADLFAQMISETDPAKQNEFYTRIKTLETACDEITQEIFAELNDTFVTPFDREDMHELCDTVDDVMDWINSSAKRTILYQPKSIPNKAMHMAEIILEDAKAINTAFQELKTINKKPDVALAQCEKLHKLEHEGDDVYDNFVKDLFETEDDARELIKIKEIMSCMEEATDRANRVGKTLKTIIVKYA